VNLLPREALKLAALPLWLVIAILSQSSCYTKFSYGPLESITRIAIYDQDQILKEVTDPSQVAEIVRFINEQRHGWYTPIQGTPMPKIKLRFYTNEEFKGNFGVGEDFFGPSVKVDSMLSRRQKKKFKAFSI
jgi:hypothetical protein